jgi:Fe-S-cluster-containing dehydrogenase component/DMSO reductase anchor subunit
MTQIDVVTPIDEFLAAQRDLTAVERFAHDHDHDHDRSQLDRPLHEDWYRALMPASPPAPGQQYRFEVDLAACTGCKSCVAACHSLNGLDDGESWRRTGTLIGVGEAGPTQQTVTTSCHHCVEPACLTGCPVDAYEKDPVTGVVRHLDDQCIGCSYCTFTCPYDVPRFNHRLGIVRKCDMCADRLAVGEAPACVQACPTGAIAIGIVDVAELVATTTGDQTLVPGAPRSAATVPTTLYLAPHTLPPDAVAGDHWSEAPAHGHLPLVVMLVLTQLAVGAFALLTLIDGIWAEQLSPSAERWVSTGALVVGVLALVASIGHLGRPLQAWRAVIGLGHSWLSREIVAFGGFAALAVLASVWRWSDPGSVTGGVLGAAAAGVGLVGVACSMLVYAVTGRRCWRLDRTARAFAGTTAVAGIAAVIAVLLAAAGDGSGFPSLVTGLAVAEAAVTGVLLAGEALLLRPGGPRDPYLARAGRLLRGSLSGLAVARFYGGIVGGIVLPLFLVVLASQDAPSVAGATGVAVTSLALVIGAELAGRQLFFRAQTSPRMPGVPR